MRNELNSMIMVLVTVGSTSEGQAIASALVQDHLAACVSIFPVGSTYRWQGDIHVDQEWQLMIKTQLGHFEAIETCVRSLHSYDLPEIVAIPVIKVSDEYLSWVRENTSPID